MNEVGIGGSRSEPSTIRKITGVCLCGDTSIPKAFTEAALMIYLDGDSSVGGDALKGLVSSCEKPKMSFELRSRKKKETGNHWG